MRRALSARHLPILFGILAGCGSRTGLTIPEYDAGFDAGVDADRPRDAGFDGGPPIDLCVELPFLEPPRAIEIEFLSQIQSADVFFLVDVTGSMGEEIEAIRSQVRDRIIPGLATAIPDARFSVGHFADFPVREYGEEEDEVFRVLQTSTTNVSSVQTAVNRLPFQGGRDGPEAMTEALYQTATGEGIGRFVTPAGCPASSVGYPCFSPVGSRIILLFSDAPTHNGPFGSESYDGFVRPEPHTYDETVSELRAIGAKVLGLYSGDAFDDGLRDLQSYARDTGAIRPDGSPVVLDIGRDGSALSESVVEAVRTLVDEVPLDVDAVVEDLEGDAFDATMFVEQIIALSADPASGATIVGDRFDNVTPGTRVTFRIMLANDLIPQTSEPQFFLMRVVLRGDGVIRLRETTVRVVIPPIGGGVFCSF